MNWSQCVWVIEQFSSMCSWHTHTEQVCWWNSKSNHLNTHTHTHPPTHGWGGIHPWLLHRTIQLLKRPNRRLFIYFMYNLCLRFYSRSCLFFVHLSEKFTNATPALRSNFIRVLLLPKKFRSSWQTPSKFPACRLHVTCKEYLYSKVK